MKIKYIALIVAVGMFSTLHATSVPPKVDTTSVSQTLAKPSPKVQALIDKHKLQVVDTAYVKERLGKGTRTSAKAVIIDARPTKKYAISHVPTAINIPDTDFEKFVGQLKDVDKQSELITYCGGWKCAKSPKLAGMLQAKGFTDIKVYQEGFPAWKKSKNYHEVDKLLVKSALKKQDTIFIDARPEKKFLASHIPTSINIHDSDMDKLMDRFPADKAQKAIIYCGGYKCAKSHNVAKKMVGLGYTNVAVYAAGLPEWMKSGQAIEGKLAEKATAAESIADNPYIEKDGIQLVVNQEDNQNMVYGPWYLDLIKEVPKEYTLVDVRAADDYAAGHIPGAVSIPFSDKDPKGFVDKVQALDTKVILNCAAGAMATESMTAVIDEGGDLSKIFFVDANLDCNKNNECKIEINEPL